MLRAVQACATRAEGTARTSARSSPAWPTSMLDVSKCKDLVVNKGHYFGTDLLHGGAGAERRRQAGADRVPQDLLRPSIRSSPIPVELVVIFLKCGDSSAWTPTRPAPSGRRVWPPGVGGEPDYVVVGSGAGGGDRRRAARRSRLFGARARSRRRSALAGRRRQLRRARVPPVRDRGPGHALGLLRSPLQRRGPAGSAIRSSCPSRTASGIRAPERSAAARRTTR